MNCPYCHSILEIPIKQYLYPKAVVCIPCSCLFLIDHNQNIIKTTFYLVYNTIDYQIVLDYISNTTKIEGPECPQIDKEMKAKSNNTHTRMISTLLKLPEIISISPTSALNKLKLLLTFS